jgi:hypothetical protein
MNKIYECEICNKEFKTSQALNGHKKVHDKVLMEEYKERRIQDNLKIIKDNTTNYGLNPSKCLFCFSILPYEKRHNKFCNSSHAASFNNAEREKSEDFKASKNKKISTTLLNKTKKIEIQKTCYCGNTFTVSKNNKAQNRKIYCSIKCAGKINIRKMHKKNAENYGNFSTYISNFVAQQYRDGTKLPLGGRTKWYTYKNHRVQGTYELRTCAILDNWLDNNLIKSWDYTRDRIPYVKVNGKDATYLLDFKVENNDDTVYYIETKGFKRENDQLKWDAAKAQGINLVVWFDEDIKREENKIQA